MPNSMGVSSSSSSKESMNVFFTLYW